jgi:hypothetical protein
MSKIDTTFHIQQGSSGTLRVSDEDAWYFVGEAWEGSKLLNTWIESRHATKDEALAAWTMTLTEASVIFEIPYQTLATACQEERLSARKSAGTWLVTARAVKEFKLGGKAMKHYRVTVNPVDVTEPGNLQFLSRITDDYSADYIDTDENGNEVYEVQVSGDFAAWVERQLDLTAGVVSYEKLA